MFEGLGRLEGFQKQKRRDQTGKKRDEDAASDQGIDRTPDHVDQKYRQHYQRYEGEKQ
jgi:hypothetical protein